MRGQDLSSADLIDKCRNKDADYRYHESQGRQIKYVKQSKKNMTADCRAFMSTYADVEICMHSCIMLLNMDDASIFSRVCRSECLTLSAIQVLTLRIADSMTRAGSLNIFLFERMNIVIASRKMTKK